MGAFRNLIVWQKAMDLVDSVYSITRSFPRAETFGLTQQIRSAAYSVPANLAEGCGRYTAPDELRFVRQARGSIYELQTLLEVARRQQYIAEGAAKKLERAANEVGRLVNGYGKAVLRRAKSLTANG